MRRTLLLIATAAGIAFGGSVLTAGAAAAAPPSAMPDAALGHANAKSALFYCGPGSTSDHPGQHVGWTRTSNGERRNLGGTCPTG